MLNEYLVLDYVKGELGFPFQPLEFEDKDILEHIQKFSIPTFSHYAPQKKKMDLNFLVERNKVAGRSNEFYLFEPEGREILNISEIYFDQSSLYALGHPPMGVFSEFELRGWALQVHQAMTTKMFSSWDFTFEFHHPNRVRISPLPIHNERIVTVEYERKSQDDFSEIPNDVHRLFLDLALSDVMITIGRMRKKYGGGNLRTPFGEIPLESEIFDEGKELKREVIEKLERLFTPNILVDHG